MRSEEWAPLAAQQHGMIARRQLRQLGVDRHRVRSHIRARRWAPRSSRVISTFTGDLTFTQRCWLGVLHAGGPALVAGLSSAALYGLKNWPREDISVLVPDNVILDHVPGIRWVRTRRDIRTLRTPQCPLPVARLAPAVLMFGAADPSPRTAVGVLAAVIQQELATPAELSTWIERLTPLRRAPLLRASVADFAGGADSLAEIDVGKMCQQYCISRPARQARRRDASGRWRYQDCEWQRHDGGVIVLEVDGSFHMDAAHWQDDIARARDLADPKRLVIRCTAFEMRTDPTSIALALRRLGVPPQSRDIERAA